MRPHDLAPVVVTQDLLPSLLAEPDARRRPAYWLQRAFARLLAASSGPVLQEGVSDGRLALAGWSLGAWPTLPALRELRTGLGSPAPSLVFVGERDPRGVLPFFARSGVWLLRAVRELGYAEETCYLANAFAPHGAAQPLDALAAVLEDVRPQPTWVALGEIAQDACARLDVDALGCVHPAWHKRFAHAEDVAGYARRLLDAGVPPGPWRGLASPNAPPLPVGAAVTGEGEDLPDDLRMAPVHGFRRSSGARKQRGYAAIAAEKANRGRQAYVTGEAKTLAEASRIAGANARGLGVLARQEDWERLRQEHAAEVAEKARKKSVEDGARALAATTKLAWGAATLAMSSVVKRLQNETLVPTPAEAAILVRTARELSSDPVAGEEAPHLRLLAASIEARMKAAEDLPEPAKDGPLTAS